MNKKQIYSNYKRNNKFLGIIDYKSLSFLVIYLIIVWNILNLFNISQEYIIYLFIFLTIPVISILCININEESAIEILLIIIKYLLTSKQYICTDFNVKDVDNYLKNYVKIDKKS